ncbi:hypothetical protein [Carnobacterium divergens]|uniref:hypothetical protein n=1 Tax=Carnobacterium divergens TaxID=2748 RepID=UPI0014322383|nr:hypothetical protein [Carnobacterium divergens]
MTNTTIVYKLATDDITQFIENTNNEKQILDLFKSTFSCMEAVKEFVEITELQLKKDSN